MAIASAPQGQALRQMYHTAWTPREGAPTSINDLAQTADGFLWIGTESGLFRFDGARFERFTPSSGPDAPNVGVFFLRARDDGGLWIGWRSRDLTYLKDGKYTTYSVDDGLPAATVTGLREDGRGRVWAATSVGLYLQEGKRWRAIFSTMGYAGGTLNVLAVDRAGTLWVSDLESVFSIAKNEQTFHLVVHHPKIFQMKQDKAGTTWGLDRTGGLVNLSSMEPEHKIWQLPVTDKTVGLLFNTDGTMWISTAGGGILRTRSPTPDIPAMPADLERLSAKDGSLSDDFIGATLQDREGNIWISTNRGLDRLRVSALNTADIPSSFNNIGLLAARDGDMYVAPREVALVRIPRPLTVAKGSTAPLSVTCAYSDPYGVEWFGTRTGLYRKDGDSFIPIQRPFPERDVQAITTDGDHGLWVAISQKKALFHYQNGAWTLFGDNPRLSRHTPFAATTDAQGRVWFGYGESIVSVLSKDGTVRTFDGKEDDEIGEVATVYAHGPNVWVGGGHGLRRFFQGRFEQIRSLDPHSLEGISGIVETETGDLWLNGARNIALIQAADLQRAHVDPAFVITPRIFDVFDGLSGGATQGRPIPSAVVGSDGKIWFALTNSVVWIDPNNIAHNNILPPVVIESLTADHRQFRNLQNAKLPSDPADVRIDYTALSLSVPERVLFRYKLEGVDSDWQDAGNRRQAFYTQLRPGRYHFQVIASNNDGLWNTTGASLTFEVPPTMLETLWFRTLLISLLALLCIMFVLWRFRVGTERVRSQLSERVVERERIARELHDTLLQGFQGLIFKFQTVAGKMQQGDPARVAMENALDRADEILLDGRNRVLDLRVRGLGIGDLCDAFAAVGQENQCDRSVEIKVTASGTYREMHPIVLDEVYSVGKEALLNAIRHAEAKTIECQIFYGEQHFGITILDDGKGVDPQTLSQGRPGHWGLGSMRERAQKLLATLVIQNRSGFQGLELHLRVPANVAYMDKQVRTPLGWFRSKFRGNSFARSE